MRTVVCRRKVVPRYPRLLAGIAAAGVLGLGCGRSDLFDERGLEIPVQVAPDASARPPDAGLAPDAASPGADAAEAGPDASDILMGEAPFGDGGWW